MRFHTFALAAALALVSGQASALSCMRPDVARAFNWASASDQSYVALLGRFDFEATERPEPRDINNPVELSFDARFFGQALGAEGFGPVGDLDVTVVFACMGPWCGGLPDTGEETLAFVERSDAGYVLRAGPCGAEAFVNPSAEDVARVEACMRGEGCAEGDLR